MARTERDYLALQERVREVLFSKPITVTLDLTSAVNASGVPVEQLIEVLAEMVLQNIYNSGGFCDYEFHLQGADFSDESRDWCARCGRDRASHVKLPVLLCPDEAEHARGLEAEHRWG